MRVRRLLALGLAVLFALPATAHASIPIAEWDDGDHGFELSGYLRSLSGVSYLHYADELPDPNDEIGTTSGLNAEAIRLEWTADVSDVLTLELHNEFFFQVSSAGSAGGPGGLSQLGLGASVEPDRTVDLRSEIIDQDGLRFTHNIDRLAANIYTDAADITVGRQGITWGKSTLFPVADLWSRFSPFEIDTTQKPGIDAVRALVYPSLSSEVDIVVADRGSLEDLSGGVRSAFTIGSVDLMVGAGKFWNEIAGLVGVTGVLDTVKLRAEAVLPWNLDDEELKLPRATAGVEYYSSSVIVGAEYHFNGTGADEPAGYIQQANSEEFQRGETYFLGRHYLGAYTTYSGVERLTLNLSTIGNLTDPSVIVSPSVRYEIAQNTEVALGAYVTAGESPTIPSGGMLTAPQLNSEFGTFGHFFFAEIAGYF